MCYVCISRVLCCHPEGSWKAWETGWEEPHEMQSSVPEVEPPLALVQCQWPLHVGAWEWVLYQLIYKGLFQPQPFCDSVYSNTLLCVRARLMKLLFHCFLCRTLSGCYQVRHFVSIDDLWEQQKPVILNNSQSKTLYLC